MTSKRHKHTFHSLWWTFGPYADQGVHVHSCWDEDCTRVLIGNGLNCNGKYKEHWRKTL